MSAKKKAKKSTKKLKVPGRAWKKGRKKSGPIRLLKPAARQPGLKLKRIRERSGMNQYQLAQKLGYSQPHISNVERGAVAPSEELIAAVKKVCRPKAKPAKVKAPAKKKVERKPKAKKAAAPKAPADKPPAEAAAE